jgi:hypothetical protein
LKRKDVTNASLGRQSKPSPEATRIKPETPATKGPEAARLKPETPAAKVAHAHTTGPKNPKKK